MRGSLNDLGRQPVAVAIPVRDEAERIGACVAALLDQTAHRPDHIVLLVNNTTDGTAGLVRRMPMPAGTALHVIERSLPPHQANAGWARRLAMHAAARLVGPSGVLMTTDADARVDPDWVSANLAALAAGADAVAGWVELDPTEWSRIPLALHEADARETAYDRICDRIEALLDPDPHDPAPRHTQNSGASIAVTAAAWRRVGGIPAVPCGEDRAFIAALSRADARIRHALSCHVTVSGRCIGRAPGGMADTIRRRMHAPDLLVDDRLEPAQTCALRATLRQLTRRCMHDRAQTESLAATASIDADRTALLLAAPSFGIAWDGIQQASPVLRRQRLAVADLARETAMGQAILDTLLSAPLPAMAL